MVETKAVVKRYAKGHKWYVKWAVSGGVYDERDIYVSIHSLVPEFMHYKFEAPVCSTGVVLMSAPLPCQSTTSAHDLRKYNGI